MYVKIYEKISIGNFAQYIMLLNTFQIEICLMLCIQFVLLVDQYDINICVTMLIGS